METAEQEGQPAERNAASVIGADIVITGNIEATADLYIEGKVTGDVRCATLVLGESSSVKGSIHADRVRVSGEVEGGIETRDLAVEAEARVVGEVIYERLRVASGGVLEGTMKCKAPAKERSEGGRLKLVEAADGKPPSSIYID